MAKRVILVILFVALFCVAICAQDESKAKPEAILPKPDIANGKYGPYDANTFDLWKPRSNKPAPIVVYLHRGGLIRGDKSMLSAKQLEQMLEAGLAVMAINYRLTGEAVFPQHYMDCARAIQYARYHADEFNIDPKRVAATGSSAGGMISLWLGFHKDLADPKNVDPVLRESTRLRVMAVFSAQTTLVPDVATKYVGPLVTQYKTYYDGRAFGVTPEVMKSAKGLELYKAAAPLTYLTKDDPAVWAFYSVPNKEPSTPGEAIHHPGFGVLLKEEMDKLGIECKLRRKDDGQKINGDMVQFLLKYLR